MGTEDDGVLAAARAIRPYLMDLVGRDAAGLLDRQIAEQLNGAPDEPETVAALRRLLEEHEDTRWFLTEVMRDAPHYRPPYWQPRYLHPQTASPPGDGLMKVPDPIVASRYFCPERDYDWYRPDVGTPVPDCPTHHVVLIRS